MPRRRRKRSGLFEPGHRYAVSHGQIVVPATSHRGALRVAVAEARRFGAVVHVLERQGKGGRPATIATCMPQKLGGGKVIACHLQKPVKRRA